MRKPVIGLYWSVQDDVFIAEVPELPGRTTDGATRAEARANAETTIQYWIETARTLGRTIPQWHST